MTPDKLEKKDLSIEKVYDILYNLSKDFHEFKNEANERFVKLEESHANEKRSEMDASSKPFECEECAEAFSAISNKLEEFNERMDELEIQADKDSEISKNTSEAFDNILGNVEGFLEKNKKTEKADINLRLGSDEEIVEYFEDPEKYKALKEKFLHDYKGIDLRSKVIRRTLSADYREKTYWTTRTIRGVVSKGMPEIFHKFCKEVFESDTNLMEEFDNDIKKVMKSVKDMLNDNRCKSKKRKMQYEN